MNNAMQLKAIIKNMAKSKNISAQIIMQNYMLERLLERVSLSSYKTNFILKGGFLIASIVGIDTRATMDMDATLKGFPISTDSIRKMFEEISAIDANDGVSFAMKSIEGTMENDGRAGAGVKLEARHPPMEIPLKIDITSGDEITPGEIIYDFRLLLESRSIKVLAYNLETIMAEKLETIISRSDQNTRPRDFYDVHIIHKLQWHNIRFDALRAALKATAENRGSLPLINRYTEILQTIKNSKTMKRYWQNYQSQFDYAKDLDFEDICMNVIQVLDKIIQI